MKAKKYSLPYWVKQNTRYASHPENVILDAVTLYVERGDHPEINFLGAPTSVSSDLSELGRAVEPLELACQLYIEWRKKPGAYPGLFPTPLDVALRAARLLELQPGQRVLDAGAGFGNLSWSVRECGGAPVGVEVQPWVHQMNQALGMGAELGDLLDGYTPPPFDAVIVNPPFGKVYGSTDATLDFMTRIADLSRPGTLVAAILPASYMTVANPKKAQATMMARYEVLSEEHLPATTFRPLTNVGTTLYLLKVTDSHTSAISPGKRAQKKVRLVHQEDVVAQPTTEELLDIIEAKGREVTESLAALRATGEGSSPTALSPLSPAERGEVVAVSTCGIATRGASCLCLPDPQGAVPGRPRAELPDELVQICERQHVLDYRLTFPNLDHPAFEDDELMIRGAQLDTGQWRWDALYFHDGAALEIDLWREGDQHEIISGPDAIAALAALKSHLHAWGVNSDIQLAPDPLPSGLPRAPIPYDLYRRRAARHVLWHSPEPQVRYEQWEDNGLRLIKMPDGAWWAYYLDADNQELPIPWGKAPDGHDLPLTGDTAEECAELLQEHFEAWGCPTLITFREEPFKKQLAGAVADEFIKSIPTFGVTWLLLPDGRPRAALPEGLRERLKGNAVHTFQFRWLNEQPAFVTASDLRLVGERLDNGQWKWTAQDGAVKIARHDQGDCVEFIEGATALEALAALREHLRAWEINTQLTITPRDAWQVDEIALLIQELDRRPILVDDPSLGILTPHDLAAHAEHMGYGLFKLETPDYHIHFDGGSGLRCFPGGHGWSPIVVKRGQFPYDTDGVRKTLQAWLTELGGQPTTGDCAVRSTEAAQSAQPTELPTQPPADPAEARQLLAQAEKLYSGSLLAQGSKVKGLIQYDGQQWVSTGGCFSQWAKLQRVVPRQDWTGEVFDKSKPHGTCTPETFYTGRLVQHRGQEWVMTDEVLTITILAASSVESTADVQTHDETPATQAAPTPKKIKSLPDGIPEMIEVDVGGRTARWEQAQVVGVVSGKLVCQLAGGQGHLLAHTVSSVTTTITRVRRVTRLTRIT